MSNNVIEVENLSKQYRLGLVGRSSLQDDFARWWAAVRGKEDPFLKVGEANRRDVKGESQYVWSLKDVSFTVKQGEVLGIIGRNGAGKSTLLKILSKVTGPTTGKVRVKGRIASLLEVGTGFHPELTGRENVFLNGAILGMRRQEIKAKFDEIVAFSGVERYVDTPVKRYSSGMYVRLAFAVAAHLEPEILIVDEVLAVGDAEFQKKCIGKMKDVSGQGRTVLFVSHNMAAVKTLCNTGMVLEFGSLVYEGTSEEACNFYLSRKSEIAAMGLEDRSDRRGDGRLRIKEIQLINQSGILVNDLISGEPCKVRFVFQRNGKINPNEFTAVLQFYDLNERHVTTVATDEMGIKFKEIPESGFLEIDIPKLNFRGGVYFISYMISEKKSFSTPHNIIDSLASAMEFTVIGADIYDSGVILRPNGFIQESKLTIHTIR